MVRLKKILLAGTILPALTLLPLGAASAQAPDQGERHGQHGEGGARGEGKGGEAGHAQRQGGERTGGGERRQGGPGARENAQGERTGGPNGSRGEERNGRKAADEGSRAKPADRPARASEAKEPGDANTGGRAAQSREQRKELSRDRDDANGRKGAGRDNAQTDRAGGDRDNGPRGGDRTRAGERQDRARDERTPDNRQRAGERGPDDRTRAGDRNDRGPANRDRADDRRQGDPLKAGERDRRNDPRQGNDERRIGVGPAAGVAPGFAGGFMAPTQARRLDDLRRDRREVREGDNVFIREPGRTIVQERGRAFIVHDETDRFRALGLNVRRERRGAEVVDITTRPGGEEILTFTDGSGRMLRRVRRTRDGREFVLIDNGVGGRIAPYAEDVVVLPPPPLRIPRDRYVLDYRDANPNVIYDTLIAPPLAVPPRRYTLDQVRYSPDVRNYVRSVDINTINFDSGSWDVPAAATGKLEALATAINRAVDRNPNAVFLIEGYTDATGNPNDNLSLSDRRAQSVAEILSKDFKVPPENLTTQGYGQQNPKEDTSGPSAVNRRVVVRNITQLLAAGDAPQSGQ